MEDQDTFEGGQEQCRAEGEEWAGGGQLAEIRNIYIHQFLQKLTARLVIIKLYC